MTCKIVHLFFLGVCAVSLQAIDPIAQAEEVDPHQLKKHFNTLSANTVNAGSIFANYEVVTGNLEVKGSESVDNNLNVGGSENIANALSVAGNENIGGNLAVTGNLIVGGQVLSASCCATLATSIVTVQSELDVISANQVTIQSQLDIVSERLDQYLYIYDVYNVATPQAVPAGNTPPSTVSFSTVTPAYKSNNIVVNSVNAGINNQIVINEAGLYRFSFMISCYPTDAMAEQLAFGLAQGPAGTLAAIPGTTSSSYSMGSAAGQGQQIIGTFFINVTAATITAGNNLYYVINNGANALTGGATFDAANIDAYLEIEKIGPAV